MEVLREDLNVTVGDDEGAGEEGRRGRGRYVEGEKVFERRFLRNGNDIV